MHQIATALKTVLGVAFAAMAVVVATIVGFALVGLLLLVGIGAALVMKLTGRRPMMARSGAQTGSRDDGPGAEDPAGRKSGERIWNDGRGTIIDM